MYSSHHNIGVDNRIKIRILCCGNALHGDDALGRHAFLIMRQYRWPPWVELLEITTGGVALVPYCRGCNQVVIVDALRGCGRAGEVIHLADVRTDHLLSIDLPEHGGSLADLLQWLPLLVSPVPRIDLFGIVGLSFDAFSWRLSTPVAQGLCALCQQIHQAVIDQRVP